MFKVIYVFIIIIMSSCIVYSRNNPIMTNNRQKSNSLNAPNIAVVNSPTITSSTSQSNTPSETLQITLPDPDPIYNQYICFKMHNNSQFSYGVGYHQHPRFSFYFNNGKNEDTMSMSIHHGDMWLYAYIDFKSHYFPRYILAMEIRAYLPDVNKTKDNYIQRHIIPIIMQITAPRSFDTFHDDLERIVVERDWSNWITNVKIGKCSSETYFVKQNGGCNTNDRPIPDFGSTADEINNLLFEVESNKKIDGDTLFDWNFI